MRKVIRNLILILNFLFFTSCDILESDSSSLSPLDSKIDFKVIESYDNYETISTPKFFMELISEKIYGCCNYGIATDYKIGDKTIDINILGIDKPGVCLTALGPANGRIKLGELSGVYEITIKGEGFVNKYNLLISDSLIILDGKETPHTKPLIYFLYRYPKNSFAYLCGTTLSDTSICGGFIDTLKSVIDITEFYFSDIAEIPYPSSSQGHYYDAKARYFYYKTEEEFDKIQEVMKSYKQTYFPNDNGVGLSIVNWINKKFYSWLL
ncbi:MAG: hypothetical protein MUO34_12935 [Ignavibacteriaceae bacterium]|nr:hypothetical protein [Ignavibacteriaceae bacterium]